MHSSPIRIVFGWSGLPIYAARCIERCRAAGNLGGFEIDVIYTSPTVPISGLEAHLGARFLRVPENTKMSWSELPIKVPDIFIHTGWAYPVFMALGDEVRKNGGAVVSMVDNCWKGDVRQLIGAIYFRIFLRRRFKAIWVPGRSATRLAHFLGMPPRRVINGLYGMDPALFGSCVPLSSRPKEILFVGRLIERKGLWELLEAFERFSKGFPGWTLKIIGEGPLRSTVPSHPSISVHPFSPPEQIAAAMAQARVLALPSREEHWGLVVHEAALSGCALLLSDKVGAHHDLLDNGINGILFRAHDASDIVRGLATMASWAEPELSRAEDLSLAKAKAFGPERFFQSFQEVLALCSEQRERI